MATIDSSRPVNPRNLSSVEQLQRMRSILINACEGRRSVVDDRDYASVRAAFLRTQLPTPSLIRTHPSIDSFMAFIGDIKDRRERVAVVTSDFTRALGSPDDQPLAADASTWTGTPLRKARARTIVRLLPLAQSSVEGLIAAMSEPNGNGGPLMDEREEALTNLRDLHSALGELLNAVEAGHLDDDLGRGLAADAARFAKRFARSVRHDPMPYVSSALLLGVLSACGLPGIGGYLAGVAINVRKNAARDQ